MDWRDYIQVTQYITSIGLFYKKLGSLWRGVWLWRISGGYLQEMMWVTLRGVLVFLS